MSPRLAWGLIVGAAALVALVEIALVRREREAEDARTLPDHWRAPKRGERSG